MRLHKTSIRRVIYTVHLDGRIDTMDRKACKKRFSLWKRAKKQAWFPTLSYSLSCYTESEFSQSSCFLLVFFGCRERLLALHSGQIGAFLWICWWQDRQAFMGGGCCWRKCLSPGGPRLLTSCCAAAAAAANWEATGGGGGSCGSGFQPGGARSRNLASNRTISGRRTKLYVKYMYSL